MNAFLGKASALLPLLMRELKIDDVDPSKNYELSAEQKERCGQFLMGELDRLISRGSPGEFD